MEFMHLAIWHDKNGSHVILHGPHMVCLYQHPFATLCDSKFLEGNLKFYHHKFKQNMQQIVVAYVVNKYQQVKAISNLTMVNTNTVLVWHKTGPG
jgi:transposase-like protein